MQAVGSKAFFEWGSLWGLESLESLCGTRLDRNMMKNGEDYLYHESYR